MVRCNNCAKRNCKGDLHEPDGSCFFYQQPEPLRTPLISVPNITGVKMAVCQGKTRFMLHKG